MCMYINTCVKIYINRYTYLYIYLYILTNIFTYTHIYTFIYLCIYKYVDHQKNVPQAKMAVFPYCMSQFSQNSVFRLQFTFMKLLFL